MKIAWKRRKLRFEGPATSWSAEALERVQAALISGETDEGLRALVDARLAIAEADKVAASICDSHRKWLAEVKAKRRAKYRDKRQLKLPLDFWSKWLQF